MCMVGRINKVVDLLFPSHCQGCGQDGAWWCTECQSRVLLNNTLQQTPTWGLAGIAVAAPLKAPLTRAIKALKYHHGKAVAPSLASYLHFPLTLIPDFREALLVPIPLHPRKLRARGHNQAALLAQELALQSGLPYAESMQRVRHTPSQTTLSRSDRSANVEGAFAWRGRTATAVILVDDICTTGATLDSAAEACLAAGVHEVWGLVVAQKQL